MEYLEKEVKEHIKHMFSNKTERNVRNRSSAISSIREHYDEMSGVVRRSKRHVDKSAVGDELAILNELKDIRPFWFSEGRRQETVS